MAGAVMGNVDDAVLSFAVVLIVPPLLFDVSISLVLLLLLKNINITF